MQVSVESTGALERRMRVEIPEDRIEGEVKGRLQELTKTARIDGFRRGKVPVSVIKQRYGKQVRSEVLGEVLRSSFTEALSAEDLHPAGEPTIEQGEGDASDQGLSYTAVFEVYPEISLNPVDKLSITEPTCEVTDADTEKMLETLRKQQVSWNETEAPAENGSQVNIDFEGFLGEETFEGGAAEGFELELGSNRFIAGFEEGLIGAKAGDKLSLDLEFPDPYQNPDLSGKPVRFEVTVNTVAEPELAELNDEFFSRYGVTEGGMDAFKSTIRENMERECEQRVKNQAKSNVFNALHDANPFELPQALVESEAAQLLESSKQRLMQQGMPAEQLDYLKKDSFLDEGRKRVALGLLMSEIIKENEMKADPNKVRTTIEAMAANYEDPAEMIQWYYADQSRLTEIQSLVLEEEVVSWIKDQASVETQALSFDVLMNPESVESTT